jgi:hypothetical protein
MKINAVFILLIVCCIPAFSNGQGLQQGAVVKKINNPTLAPVAPLSYNKMAGTTPIWSDDFSVPANWILSKDPATSDNWVIGTTPPVHTLDKIKSSTAANGFALFDSDQLCSHNQIAYLSTSNPIDLSAHPNVKLSFQQNYGKFKDSTFVAVSTDNISWVKFSVNADYDNNDFSPNPENVSINISSAAGGKKTVWLRFIFYSVSPKMGPDAGCAYSWQIDDVNITDIPKNDIALKKAFIEVGSALFYSQIPKSQIDYIRFLALSSNLGTSYQTGVKLNVSVSDGTSQVYNQDSYVLDTMRYMEKDTFAIFNNYFLPSALSNKTYTVTLKAKQNEIDFDTTNNSIVRSFAITDSVLARDKGDLINSSYTSPNIYKGGESDGSSMGVLYSLVQPMVASSVSVYIDSLTSLNTSISAYIYEANPAGAATPFTKILSSDFYLISSSSKKNKWVSLPIKKNGAEVLSAKKLYLVSIVVTDVYPSSGTIPAKRVLFKSDISTKQRGYVTWVYLSTPQLINGQTINWVVTKDAPFIRLNLQKNVVGLKEISNPSSLEVFQNEPNPFEKTSRIRYILQQPATIKIELFDITGRRLNVWNEGLKNQGEHDFSLNAEGITAGTYFYTLHANGFSVTKRLLVAN